MPGVRPGRLRDPSGSRIACGCLVWRLDSSHAMVGMETSSVRASSPCLSSVRVLVLALSATLLVTWFGPRATSHADETGEIDQAVASALFQRARFLFGQGAYKDAKVLVIESLERSPDGPVARDATALLRAANKKLGLALDHGMPASRPSASKPGDTSPGELADPYDDTIDVTTDSNLGDKPRDDWGESIDPYASSSDPDTASGSSDSAGSVDGVDNPDSLGESGSTTRSAFYDDEQEAPDPELDHADDLDRGRRTLTAYGGLYGLVAGLALAGPQDDFGEVGGAPIVLGAALGAAGVAGGYYLARRHPYTEGQAATIGWAGIWGGALLGYLTDVATGVGDSTTNEIYKGVALGGLAGTGAGMGLASKLDPSVGDVALASSFGLYGMTGGLLLGVAIDPPESEAYSINALIGTSVGLAVGLYAAQKLETTRRRMLWVDLGAAAGAVTPWILVYPLLGNSNSDFEDNSGGKQAVGLLSAIGLAAGGYVAWRLTRKMDGNYREISRARPLTRRARTVAATSLPPPPGLLQRHADGSWQVGALSLRPAANPALTPARGAHSLAVDLLGGRF